MAMQEPTFWILTSLAAGPRHGYGIMTDVERISEGGLRLRAGTLYAALDRLRLPVGVRRSVGRHGPSRQDRPRSPGKGGAATGALIDQRLGAAGVVEMQPLHHRLRVTARPLGNTRGAALLSDLIERQKALAGARMGRAHRQLTEIRRRLIPSRMLNTQHDRAE